MDWYERKKLKDKTRKRKGAPQKRNRQILLDGAAKAFVGWVAEPQPWTITTCRRYIEWCHIDKYFPHARHTLHLKQNEANLWYCSEPKFVQRCIEIYKFLYCKEKVEGSKVSLFLAQGVYAEVMLERVVDWRSVPTSKNINVPRTMHIPKGAPLTNPLDAYRGLAKRVHITKCPSNDEYQWSESSSEDENNRGNARASLEKPKQTFVVVAPNVEPIEVQDPLLVPSNGQEEVVENVAHIMSRSSMDVDLENLLKEEEHSQQNHSHEKNEASELTPVEVGNNEENHQMMESERVKPKKSKEELEAEREMDLGIIRNHLIHRLQRLELHFMNFKFGQGGASSSRDVGLHTEDWRQISQHCEEEKRGYVDALNTKNKAWWKINGGISNATEKVTLEGNEEPTPSIEDIDPKDMKLETEYSRLTQILLEKKKEELCLIRERDSNKIKLQRREYYRKFITRSRIHDRDMSTILEEAKEEARQQMRADGLLGKN